MPGVRPVLPTGTPCPCSLRQELFFPGPVNLSRSLFGGSRVGDWLYNAKETGAKMEIMRSEEHTSELQSLRHLVCRLLLEKKKKRHMPITPSDHWDSSAHAESCCLRG